MFSLLCAATATLSVRAWLRSPDGQGFLCGQLEQLLRERTGLSVRIGGVRGGLVSGVTLEDVRASDGNTWEARAPRVALRWLPARRWPLQLRPGLWLALDGPEVHVHAALEPDGSPGLPLSFLAGAAALAIERLTITGGSLTLDEPAPRALTQVALSLRVRFERDGGSSTQDRAPSRAGRGTLALDALTASLCGPWGAIPFAARGQLTWDGPARRALLPELTLVAGDTRLEARGQLDGGRLDLALAPLHLAPREARALWPLGVDPRHAIDAVLSLSGTISGTLPRLFVRSVLQPGHGAAWLRGELDLGSRTLGARALLQHLRPDFLQMGAAAVLSGVVDLRYGQHRFTQRSHVTVERAR